MRSIACASGRQSSSVPGCYHPIICPWSINQVTPKIDLGMKKTAESEGPHEFRKREVGFDVPSQNRVAHTAAKSSKLHASESQIVGFATRCI